MLRGLLGLAFCLLLMQGCASSAYDTYQSSSRSEQSAPAKPDLPKYDPHQLDRIEIDEDANHAPEPKDGDRLPRERPESVKIDLINQE